MKRNSMRSSASFPSKAKNNAPKTVPMIGTTKKLGFPAGPMKAKPIKNEAIHVRKVAAPGYAKRSTTNAKGFTNKG